MINQKTKFKQTEIGMIPEEWEVMRLNDITSNITDGKHGDCKNEEKSGYYFISCKDINNGKINYENARQIAKKDFEEANKRTKLEINDILLTNSGTIGRLAIVRDKELASRTTFQKSVAILKPKQDKISPEYFYYSLLSNVKRLIEASGGTTQKNLLLKDIRSFSISICNIPEQRAIAKILSDLDAKIELNQQMNKTLEAIGKAIFKHWFVDFEFPNEEGKPYKSSGGEMVYNEELGKEIPKGWKVGKLGELIVRNKEKFNKKEEWKNEKIIDLSIMPSFSICINSFSKGEDFDSNIFKVKEMDILYGSVRPYFGKAGLSPINGGVAGTVFSYLPKIKEHYGYVLFLTSSRDFIDFTVSYSRGTKMPIISWDDFCSYRITLPKEDNLLARFNSLIIPIVVKIKENIQQSQTLSSIRDALLPKLMSGKIRVPVEAWA